MAKATVKKQFPLSDVVDGIREDLQQAVLRHENEHGWQPMFKIEDLEVELSVRFAEAIDGGIGVKAFVVDFSTKGQITNETAHKIKFRLKPMEGDFVLLGPPENGKDVAEIAAKTPAKKGSSRR